MKSIKADLLKILLAIVTAGYGAWLFVLLYPGSHSVRPTINFPTGSGVSNDGTEQQCVYEGETLAKSTADSRRFPLWCKQLIASMEENNCSGCTCGWVTNGSKPQVSGKLCPWEFPSAEESTDILLVAPMFTNPLCRLEPKCCSPCSCGLLDTAPPYRMGRWCPGEEAEELELKYGVPSPPENAPPSIPADTGEIRWDSSGRLIPR